MEPGPDAAGLYGLEVPAFTAARDALAKQLRAAGDRTESDRVKKLRRPSLTAWALNQAARERPDLVVAALDARARLGAATQRAIDGDPSDMRQAQLDERRAVDELVDAAAGILEGGGHPAADAARMRMAGTVRAASLDDEVAAGLRQGVLDRDHQATGLGGFGLDGSTAGLAAARPGPAPPTAGQAATTSDAGQPPAAASDDVARRRAKRLATELASEADDRARRADRLRDAAARAERDADKATQAAELADRNAAEARRAADQAEQRAAAARRNAVDAQQRAAGARESRDEAERDAAEARRRADDAQALVDEAD